MINNGEESRVTRPKPASVSFIAIVLVIICCHICCQRGFAQAERFFPESTKGFLSITNLEDFANKLDQTAVGDLRRTPEAKEFFDSFVKNVKARIQEKSKVSLGLTLDELKGMVDGEVAVGLIQPRDNVLAVITLAEFKDPKLVDEALEKIRKNLLEAVDPDGKVTLVQKITEAGHTVAHYEFPDPFGIAGPPQVFYGRTDKYIVAYSGPVLPETDKADHVVEVKKLLKALAGDKQPSLADQKLFQRTMASLMTDEQYANPQVKWFFESFGFVDAAKKVWPDQFKNVRYGAFRKVGFDALQAGGGVGLITPGDTEFRIRAFLYAPRYTAEQRFRDAAQMLDFTAEENRLMELPVWVDQSASSYLAVHGRMLNAFDSAKPLVDELYGEGFMDRSLNNFKENPKLRANFDLRNGLFANLRNRIVAIRDPQFPAKPGNNRVILAIDIGKDTPPMVDPDDARETERRQQVAKVIKGFMDNEDRNFVETITHPVDGQEVTIFKKIIPREETGGEPGDLDLDDLDDLDDLGALDDLGEDAGKDDKPEDGPTPLIQYYCVTQFRDQILISPDLDFMKQTLDRFSKNNEPPLKSMPWFQKINAELDKVRNPSFESLRYALRLDLPYRAVFQIVKENKGDLPVEQLIKNILGEDAKTRLFDIKKLPQDFEKSIAPHLGYVGWSMTTEKEGWMFNGIIVRKQADTSDAK